MIDFDIMVYDYACPKCGLTAPWHVEFVQRWPDWGRTSATMAEWRNWYKLHYRHDPPNPARDQWLVLSCSCGYCFEMKTADA